MVSSRIQRHQPASFLVLCLLIPTASALAQSAVVRQAIDLSTQRVRSAEDYAHARAFPLPRIEADLGSSSVPPETGSSATGHVAGQSRPPTLSDEQRESFAEVLFDPSAEQPSEVEAIEADGTTGSIPGEAYGTGGLDFTSSRLIPRSAANVYPYSPVGKIFFSDGTGDYTCTGAVIAKRLVLTAGHCLHGGPGVGYFQDFVFVPAYFRGRAPYGRWAADAAFVTQAWADVGEVPHAQDWGILEIADQDGVAIGDVVGTFTYALDLLADNHLHLLGYPGNIDRGEQMHQVASGDYFAFDDGTVVYGSDMGGGSSGGPWVQSFGNLGRGWRPFLLRGFDMAIVGVTSYGFTNPRIMAQGASELTEDFETLVQTACAERPGNC